MPADILGAIGDQDSDYRYLHEYGQEVVYSGVQQILGDHNEDMQLAEALLVEDTTWMHQKKYKLEATGRLQKLANQSPAGEVKVAGEWSVGYPLEPFGAAVASNDVDWAHMTAQEMNRQLNGVMKKDKNTRRFEMLRAVFNSAARTFVDPYWPAITVQPLANGDGTIYPPVVGSEVNSTANNYLGVAADSTTLTNANNPFPRAVNQVEQFFGTPTGGSEIVFFINDAQSQSVQLLAGFSDVPNRFVTYGENVSLVDGSFVKLPGRILGVTDSALIAEWRWIPPGYMLGIHFGAPRPLTKRVDDPATGLKTGLQLVAAQTGIPFRKVYLEEPVRIRCR